MNWGKTSTGAKVAPPKIRVERIAGPKKPIPLPSKLAQKPVSHPHEPVRSSSSSRPRPSSPSRKSSDSGLKALKRKAVRQKSPAQRPMQSDSSDDDEGPDIPEKRQKAGRSVDLKRKLRSKEAFSEEDGGVFEMIHAADIAMDEKKSKIAIGTLVNRVTVNLQYPSASQRERYNLAFEKDKINPVEEIFNIAKIVTTVYLMKEQAEPFTDPRTGIIRKLEKAKNMLSSSSALKNNSIEFLVNQFSEAVDTYNMNISKLIKVGALAKNLDHRHDLPLEMVCCILRQVYDRAVSPKVELLRQYENGTDNVYGELLPEFISKILAETKLKSDQVFVDLGSGVGNVVLQAALEIGCESWGCEMMENACTLADAQKKEFDARCRLWGIKAGTVCLERGDFLENQDVKAALRKADVILVNNQAFTSILNRKLIDLFLDTKDGCKIVSLKSFVPSDHKITSRNRDDPVNILDAIEKEYFSKSVSWTDVPGTYFISTKDAKRLEQYQHLV
ncbi:hypothetical protein B7494_g6578 [Chlorociboria aeruginascens]|nr:hypothetical protein B7494_g6578 [Chlorociboria aeruginascens]